jgi:hypothetical protein
MDGTSRGLCGALAATLLVAVLLVALLARATDGLKPDRSPCPFALDEPPGSLQSSK